ncbi:MAG: MutS family DNA mismatch repair protein, partial [Dehalococcoidia bacterium]|nr:MutS family DNA mismatch repair protein [Dehalococcoidia bacterium]
MRSADSHIAKLVAAGYKVAVIDQVEQTGGPAATLKNSTALVNREVGGAVSSGGKSLFDRRLARIVTPGTVLDPAMLDAKANNYLVAVVQMGDTVGVAAADVSTGEFTTCQTLRLTLPELLERLQPAEIVLPRGLTIPLPPGRAATPLTEREPWQFDLAAAREAIQRHFAVGALEAFGCADQPLAIRAAGALLIYLQETQRDTLGRFSKLITTTAERTMVLDAPTRRNLELSQHSRTGGSAGSLLAVLDLTKTPMGARLLRRWLFAPLIDRAPLVARQAMVTAFYEDTARRADALAVLARLGDLERLVQRVASQHAGPRDLVALARSLSAAPVLRDLAAGHRDLAPLAERLDPCADVVGLIQRAIRDDPPATLAEGGVIRPGYAAELDDLNAASRDGRAFIATLER